MIKSNFTFQSYLVIVTLWLISTSESLAKPKFPFYYSYYFSEGSDDNTLKKVKPLLNDWEKRFPQLESM